MQALTCHTLLTCHTALLSSDQPAETLQLPVHPNTKQARAAYTPQRSKEPLRPPLSFHAAGVSADQCSAKVMVSELLLPLLIGSSGNCSCHCCHDWELLDCCEHGRRDSHSATISCFC